jgi:glutathione S-transferase
MDTALEGKTYLVGEKCTIADLSFVNWDLTLNVSMKGDEEAASSEQRDILYLNWAAWHRRVTARPAVQKMIKMYEEANNKA